MSTPHQILFRSIADQAIALNLLRQESLPQVKETFGKVGWLREFATVRLEVGRQIGKTTYIKNNAQYGDVVIHSNLTMKTHFEKSVGQFHEFYNFTIRQLDGFYETIDEGRFGLMKGAKTIWFDDCFDFAKNKPEVYNNLVHMFDPRQVVIFGSF